VTRDVAHDMTSDVMHDVTCDRMRDMTRNFLEHRHVVCLSSHNGQTIFANNLYLCTHIKTSGFLPLLPLFLLASIILKLMPDHNLLRCYSLYLAQFGFYRVLRLTHTH
jgi:hypothetical protein